MGILYDEITSINGKKICDETARSSLNNIANELGRNEDGTEIDMGTTATTIRGAIKELKDNQGGGVTQEQIDSAVTSYLTENPVTGGMTSTAKSLLITILRNAMYTTNQSANITALESALASSESGGESGGDTPTVTYAITNNLTNCVNSNVNTSVAENSSYVANINANDGYTLDSVIVTMGGVDITSSAYSDGQINISSVTGNIVITASASETVSQPQLVTDGLENYFDFRNCTYDNGSTTIINATQGNGSLYTFAPGVIAEQSADYGVKMNTGRTFSYAGNGGTQSTECGNSFTWIFKCYMTSTDNPLMSSSYASLNNLYMFNYQPLYNKSDGNTGKGKQVLKGSKIKGYATISIVVDGSICKLYKDGNLIDSQDGNTIDGFVNWHNKLNCRILNNYNFGYWTQIAVYNKALSEVQLVDMIDYLKSLEVTA